MCRVVLYGTSSVAPFNVLLLRRPAVACLLPSTRSVVVCRYDRNEDTSDLDAIAQGYCLYQYESTSGTVTIDTVVVQAKLAAIASGYLLPFPVLQPLSYSYRSSARTHPSRTPPSIFLRNTCNWCGTVFVVEKGLRFLADPPPSFLAPSYLKLVYDFFFAVVKEIQVHFLLFLARHIIYTAQ